MNSSGRAEEIASWALFIALVLVSMYSIELAIRLTGIVLVSGGAWTVYRRRIGYGIRGRPVSGYLTGAPAVLAGAALICIGALMIISPETVDRPKKRTANHSFRPAEERSGPRLASAAG